ncbi:hypothetical protein BZA70DRAFT_273581 [Myxozyma melibiosi]|uniref:Uncharacterized protein n=1 Tax=Myxozyma melibiosi TaxID=54550 RepID=A0ABR1FEV3_9ASCO
MDSVSASAESQKRKRGRPPLNRPSAEASPSAEQATPADTAEQAHGDEAEEVEAKVDNNVADDDDDDEDEDDNSDDEAAHENEDAASAAARRHSDRISRKKFDEASTAEATAASATGDGAAAGDDKRIKRGRPPTVDKPHESRIKTIMRLLRKAKLGDRLLYLPFDRLPDNKQYPEYYREIADPIALDIIRRNIKRRDYPTVEAFMADLELMFNNAKQFNAPNSQIYRDTVALHKLVLNIAAEEMKKPDSAYQDPEISVKNARIPVDSIEYRGDVYRVGDWVHLSNLNDPSRPTIGQIFRTWQTADGRKWINVCWYYRPEQTVHRFDKLFYENEVVKSGQYRDHLIDEVIDKCFVMFSTKYQRGRPSGIRDRIIYCCESRYNENEKTFNKIRSWKACIPDEIRGVEYEMDLFDAPRALRRVPSPIKHLLPPDAKDDDPIPEPKMGVENAPPIIGAVYKRPPDPSMREPSPTPDPPTPAPPATTHSSATNSPHIRNMSLPPRQSVERAMSSVNKTLSRPDYARFNSGVSSGPGTPTPPGINYNGMYQQPGMPPQYNRSLPQVYNPPPPPSTFTLPDYITDRIPPDTADLYQKDENGKLLWFSVPPVDCMKVYELPDANGKGIIGHSVEFLAKRKEIAEKRKRREEERAALFGKKART